MTGYPSAKTGAGGAFGGQAAYLITNYTADGTVVNITATGLPAGAQVVQQTNNPASNGPLPPQPETLTKTQSNYNDYCWAVQLADGSYLPGCLASYLKAGAANWVALVGPGAPGNPPPTVAFDIGDTITANFVNNDPKNPIVVSVTVTLNAGKGR